MAIVNNPSKTEYGVDPAQDQTPLPLVMLTKEGCLRECNIAPSPHDRVTRTLGVCRRRMDEPSKEWIDARLRALGAVHGDLDRLRQILPPLPVLRDCLDAVAAALLWTAQTGAPIDEVFTHLRRLGTALAFRTMGIPRKPSPDGASLQDVYAHTPVELGGLGLGNPDDQLIIRYVSLVIAGLASPVASVQAAAQAYFHPVLATIPPPVLTCNQRRASAMLAKGFRVLPTGPSPQSAPPLVPCVDNDLTEAHGDALFTAALSRLPIPDVLYLPLAHEQLEGAFGPAPSLSPPWGQETVLAMFHDLSQGLPCTMRDAWGLAVLDNCPMIAAVLLPSTSLTDRHADPWRCPSGRTMHLVRYRGMIRTPAVLRLIPVRVPPGLQPNAIPDVPDDVLRAMPSWLPGGGHAAVATIVSDASVSQEPDRGYADKYAAQAPEPRRVRRSGRARCGRTRSSTRP
mmetsp:Transcript_32542/g.83175  ORF Transcript_32542/g.83175 Transcript_32542/m.83175 type:complete len:455 (+) Transcript_32542:4804-6168(+)